MGKRIAIGITIILVLVLAAGISVYAVTNSCSPKPGICPFKGTATREGIRYMKEGMRGGHARGLMGVAAHKLNLTSTQKEQLKAIWQEFRTETQPTRDEIRAKKIELMRLFKTEQPDEAKIKAAVSELTELHNRMADAGVDRLLEAKKLLAPEQNRILAEKIAEHGHMLMKCGMMAK